jgi:hydrogenase maturation factor
MYFHSGKLPSEILERLLKAYTSANHGVVVGPSIGEDAAAIDMGNKYLLAKTDPITFVAEDIGTYAIFINANDIATMGGTPRWFLATILLPERNTDSFLVEKIFQQLSSACREIDVAFCGGHTEITIGIERPFVIGVMLGEVEKNNLITTSGAKVGDDIILTKAIAIEGTSIIAREKHDELIGIFGEALVETCRRFTEKPGISVLRDAEIALRNGKIHSMHDPTEGGLATGLYEISVAANVGFIVDEDRIPVFDECAALCRHYRIDPLGLIASGSLLITLDPDDTERVIRSLTSEGIDAASIGKILYKDEGMKIKKGDKVRYLKMFERDEITKILG